MRVSTVLVIGCSLIAASPAVACKYTVRDVAFVTAGEPDYRLLVYLDDAADAEHAALRMAFDEMLADANVKAELVTLDAGGGAEDAARVAEKLGIESVPSAAVVAADGRSLLIDISGQVAKDGSFDDARLGDVRRELLETPGQSRLKELLLQGHHSVIVILEGTDAETNRSVDTMVRSAIQEVEDSLELLPKPMELGPASITLTRDQIEREAVLLWALGFDVSATSTAPQVAILMGRCRLLGPAMILPDEHESFRRRLVLVGQDCECELDRSVMQGTMLLHTWTIRNESQAAEMLGFDPGSPLVQAEVHRILARGPRSGGGELPTLDSADLALGGLQIIDIDTLVASASESEAETESATATTEVTVDAPQVSEPDEPTPAKTPPRDVAETAAVEPPATTMAVTTILAGLAIVGLIGAMLVVLRAR